MRVFQGHLSIYGLLILAPKLISSWNSSSTIGEEKIICVCDGDCELIEEKDCPWGLTLDICGCCLLCSRGEGEPCGGAVGTCAQGLRCLNHPRKLQEGICVRPNPGKVCSSPVKRFGCLFHDGNCVCETQIICEGIEIFLFDNEESCRSRIAILTARQDHLILPTPPTNQATGKTCVCIIEALGEPGKTTSFWLEEGIHIE
ncbi:unnamed protein product [Allacma fusca]|uniref:IGFBP N-terminal domain-containing protein n=1 Tax=Allacma fusca TaxID=39272 RepID=A0A8J2KVX0_9HEXA|nr:unnamed protein product [Allacma fusca]